jgi:hypothetical protein
MRIELSLFFGVAMLFATAAEAQHIGTYTGTTADGAAATIVVAKDPNNGNLEVKDISFDLDLPCSKSGETLSFIGVGLGDGQDIVNHQFSYASSNFFDIDLVVNMTFHGTDGIKGTVAGALAAFNPANDHTTFVKQVQRCFDPNQTFTATRTSAPAATRPPAAVTMRGRDGTTIAIGFQPVGK